MGGLGGDPGAARSGGQGDDPVAGPVAPSAGGDQLRPRQEPGLFPQAPGGLIEGLDIVPAVGQHQRLPPGAGVPGPGFDHGVHGPAPAANGMDAPGPGVPAHRGGHAAVAELGQGGPLAGFPLAQVVAQRPHLLAVAFAQGGEGAAGADGVELAVVADDDHLGPGPLHRPQQAAQVDIGGHPRLITNQDMPVGEHEGAVIQTPRQRGDGPRLHSRPLAESLGRLPRSSSAHRGVAGRLEPGPHRGEGGGLA